MTQHRLHHVGILTEDFGPFLRLAEALDFEVLGPSQTPDGSTEIILIDVPGSRVELVRPVTDASPVAAMIRAGQGGIHHFAFEVDDAELALTALSDQGFEVVAEPQDGIRGSRLGFHLVGDVAVETMQWETGDVWSSLSHAHVAARLFTAIEQGDVAVVRAVSGEEMVLRNHGAGVTFSLDDLCDDVLKLADQIPDFHYEDILCEVTDTGFVRRHIARGTSPGGDAFAVPVCCVGTVQGGLVTALDEYADSILLATVGLT